MTEIWKKIPGYCGYYASSLGNIKCQRGLVSSYATNGGYRASVIYRDGVRFKKTYVHRLVCLAFHKNPLAKPHVNHKNGVVDDNKPENLEWVTPQENNMHRVRILRKHTLQSVNPLKLGQSDYDEIRAMLSQGIQQSVIAEKFGVTRSYISMIKTGSRAKHCP